MTVNKQFKIEVRKFAAANGLTYADARRRVVAARDSTTVVPETNHVGNDFDGVIAQMRAQSSIEGVMARRDEAMAQMLQTFQEPAFVASMRKVNEVAQSSMQGMFSAVNVAADMSKTGAAAAAVIGSSGLFREDSVIAAAAKGPFPDGVLDVVGRQSMSIIESAASSLLNNAAAETAKSDFLDKMRVQRDFIAEAASVVGKSIGAQVVRDASETVAKIGRDAAKTMEGAWAAVERVGLDQARRQREVVFQSPSTIAALAVRPVHSQWANWEQGAEVTPEVDVSTAIAELREGQERIEALVRQLLKDRQE